MKTSSLWGTPPSRFYNYLKRVENYFGDSPLQISILGCSDGKFVLPCARRGHKVFAIDVDGEAINGGEKVGPDGPVYMIGLANRLKKEGLEDRVNWVHGDFITHPPIESHATFTSGAIQYAFNMEHDMACIMRKLQDFSMSKGFVYMDYMLPIEDRHKGRPNYPSPLEMEGFFDESEWSIIYNRVLPPIFERAHVDNPVDHYHHWGHLLAQKH